MNGVSFVSPSVPVLLQILSGTVDATDLLPSGSVYALPSNSTIEISIPGGFPVSQIPLFKSICLVNYRFSQHPMHLHGHNFDVVRVAGSTDYNYDNPVRRDVVNIGAATDNVTFRFTTNNPGPWFLHCHVDWHLQAYVPIFYLSMHQNKV